MDAATPWPTEPAKPVAALKGHTGGVTALAFSPDRELLASASRDGTGRVWNVAAKKPGDRGVFRQQGDPFHALAFSPSGRLLAAGSGAPDGIVRLYDVTDKSPREVAALRGAGGPVEALAFSPDGALVAGGGGDRTLRLWDAAPGTRGDARALLPGHTGPIRAVAFAPDGRGVATAAEDKTVRLWSVSRIRSSGRAVLPHDGEVDSVAYSPDGKVLATVCRGRGVKLWDLTAAAPTARADLGADSAWVRLVLIAPEPEVLVGVGEGGRVVHWELKTGKPARGWEVPGGPASAFALTPDGRYLARGAADGAVGVFRVAEKRT